ncbi:GNAT family N-acetyltransferase [Virgibacillus kekensis]|uniref:GNAT family N-acetyltransferase n=1 Tax=Virgibacillus kekensis TaxID=202261 RepID=A0ABV9DN13_9BACI
MIVREVKEADAAALAELTNAVESSSAYMLWEPGERDMDSTRMKKRITAMKNEKNSSIFLAEDNQRLAGYLMAIGGNANRNKHAAYLVIGVLEEYRGQGVGTALFQKLEQWAQTKNIHRLELTTVAQNNGGVALYQKMGFEIEGTKRDSLMINGEYLDEYYMSKLL